MKKALYRKYRPTSLKDVIGQDEIVKNLESAIKSDKISHSYIFIGSRGTGKTSVARIFAHAVNNFDYQIEDSYVDIIEIDAASNTGVDNIREIRERAFIAPTIGKYKIYIIDEFHMLSKSAFNALLKILEEPPEYVIFIMATTEPDRIPATIFSRSHVFYFNLASESIMTSHLSKICQSEKITIDEKSLNIIAKLGGGSFRDSITLLDQVATLSKGKITFDLTISTLGIPQEDLITSIIAAYTASNFTQISESLKNALNHNLKPELIAAEVIKKILDQPTPELLPLLSQLPTVEPPFAEAKLLVALSHAIEFKKTPTINISNATNITSPKSTKTTVAEKPLDTKSTSIINTLSSSVETKLPIANHATPTVPKPTPTTESPSHIMNVTNFSWDALLAEIKPKSIGLFNILSSAEHQLTGNLLKIFPSNKVQVSILKSQKNLTLLNQLTGEIELSIIEANNNSANTSTSSRLSAIMGGEVQEVKNGESPF